MEAKKVSSIFSSYHCSQHCSYHCSWSTQNNVDPLIFVRRVWRETFKEYGAEVFNNPGDITVAFLGEIDDDALDGSVVTINPLF